MQIQTINISLPTPLLKKVDQIAKEDYSTRSDLIRQALLEKVKQREEWQQIFGAGKHAAQKMGIKDEKEVNQIVYKFRHGKKSR